MQTDPDAALKDLDRTPAAWRWVETPLYLIAGTALVLMMLQIAADAMGKTLLGRPIPGTLEIVSFFYMPLLFFPVIGPLLRRGRHLSVDILANATGQTVAFVFAIVSWAIVAAYTGVLTWIGYEQAMKYTKLGEIQQVMTYDMIVWPGRWLVPLGFGFMTLVAVVALVGLIKNGRAAS